RAAAPAHAAVAAVAVAAAARAVGSSSRWPGPRRSSGAAVVVSARGGDDEDGARPRRRRRRRGTADASGKSAGALGDPLLAELELDSVGGCDCQLILDTMTEVDDLLTPEECDYFVEKAEAYAAREGWDAEQHDKYETRDVKVRKLGDTPLKLWMKKVQEPLCDIVSREFKLPREKV
ncbi:unnamed protein product, partial [Prorocentrum cordatum]